MKLPMTTRARLNLYRKRAADNKYGRNDWRTHKYGNTWGTPWHSGIRTDGLILTDNKDTLGDYLGDWTDFASYRDMRDTNGFYTDDHCNETIRGGVVRLRGARFTLYIPCTYCTGWDGATLYYGDAVRVPRGEPEIAHDDAKREAAANAMQSAEQEAEIAREDYAKQQAADDICTAREEIHEINRGTLSLLAEIRKAGTFSPAICQALTNQVREQLAERRKQFDIIANREANFWSAVAY